MFAVVEFFLNIYYLFTAPFIFLYKMMKVVLALSRIVGLIVIGMYIYHLCVDIEYALYALPAAKVIPYLRMAICVKTAIAVFVFYLVSLAMHAPAPAARLDFEGFKPEKVMPESVLTKARKPKCQADVFGLMNGKPVRSGQCFLHQDTLITANHVIAGFDRLLIRGPRSEISVDASVFTHIEGDISMATIAGGTAANLGLKSYRLVEEEPLANLGLFVTATGFDHSSMGMIQPHPSFGFATYTGSTIGGFSGAPYVCSDRIYGMHLGGATENLGYSSAYIKMLIDYHRESTEDFVLQTAARLGKFQAQVSPYDPTEYRVKVGRKYYMVDEEGYAKLKQSAVQEVYNDKAATYEAESVVPPPSPQVDILAANPTSTTPINEAKMQLLMSADESKNFLGQSSVDAIPEPGLSKEVPATAQNRKLLSRSATISSPRPRNSAGPKLIHAQRNEALLGISKFSKKLREELPTLQTSLSNKALKTLDDTSLSTQLTSLQQQLDRSLSDIGSIMASIKSIAQVRQEQEVLSHSIR